MSDKSDKDLEQQQGAEDCKENVIDEPQETKVEVIEKEQEAKLKAKYPGLKGPGSNMFLQKRLTKGQKYFDSGDYNMAKAKMGGAASKPIPQTQKLLLRGSTGEEIPTPEAISHRKPSMIQSKLASGGLS